MAERMLFKHVVPCARPACLDALTGPWTFAYLLRGVAELVPERTAVYGVNASSLDQIKDRFTGWADQFQHMDDYPPT